jgi:hypothetical protein
MGPNCSFTAATQNEHEAYPALISLLLEADAHDLAFSGKGVYWDYDRANPTHYGDLYPRTRPLVDGSTWDPTAFVPDLVFVNEGGNDWDQPNAGDPAPSVGAFTTAYDALVSQVRAAHPNAHIICAVGPSLNDDYPVGYNAYTNVTTVLKNVVATRTAGGDAKIHYFEFTRSLDTDLTGCEYHPNPQKHQKMATEASAYIKTILGW